MPDPQHTASFWHDVEEVFSAVVSEPESGRSAVLDQLCTARPDVRREVESLLAADRRADQVIRPLTINATAIAGSLDDDRWVGRALSHYRILSLIGSGGMGMVYRARDEVLGREVALKLLPPSFVGDPTPRRRFIEEARAAAILDHPHIAVIYEVDEADDTTFIAMELIRGEPLAATLQRGPLDPVRALELAIEIAEGLAKAHDHGIVHRDLKSGNIMLTEDDHAKIIDFGLVKRTVPDRANAERLATDAGVLMGTAAYMSPEQARGDAVDHRSDVFSFGVVVHEMLSGTRPFHRASRVDMLHAVVHAPAPRVNTFDAAGTGVQQVLDRCLAKDAGDRYQSMKDAVGDLRTARRRLESGSHGPLAFEPPGATAREWWRVRSVRRLAWVLGAAAALALVALVTWRESPRESATTPAAARFEIAPPPEHRITVSELSPDGRQLAMVVLDTQDQASLWVRAVDSGASRQSPGTEGAHSPFWSPDSRYLGFFAADKLKRVAAGGGPPGVLADVTADARGGSWGPDDIIIFSPTFQGGLKRVSAQGGPVTPLTTLDAGGREESHRWPWFLPDRRHFLFQAIGGSEPDAIYAGSLDGRAPVRVVEASSGPLFAAPGWLLYREDRSLITRSFDPDRLTVSGEPLTVIPHLVFDPLVKGARGFTASQTGLLAARSGGAPDSELVWLDRSGRTIGAPLGKANYYKPRISPNGRQVAVAILGLDADVWLWDATRVASERLTVVPGYDSDPIWSHDGATIIFSSKRTSQKGIFQRALATGVEEMILAATGFALPSDVTPDGASVFAEIFDPDTNIDLWIVPRSGRGKPTPFVRTPAVEYGANISRDGRWVAYVSNQSGRFEIYLRPFGNTSVAQPPVDQRQVSSAGGTMPVWRPDGRELYFYAPDGTMMSVPVTTTPTLRVGLPERLFSVKLKPPPDRQYDVSSEGRFLVNRIDAAELETPLTIALNWPSALRR